MISDDWMCGFHKFYNKLLHTFLAQTFVKQVQINRNSTWIIPFLPLHIFSLTEPGFDSLGVQTAVGLWSCDLIVKSVTVREVHVPLIHDVIPHHLQDRRKWVKPAHLCQVLVIPELTVDVPHVMGKRRRLSFFQTRLEIGLAVRQHVLFGRQFDVSRQN